MNLNDILSEKRRSQAQRNAEKCWPGKHKEGTKPSPTHPGIRVNNCVPNESVAEGEPGDLEQELERQDYERDQQRDQDAEHGLFLAAKITALVCSGRSRP